MKYEKGNFITVPNKRELKKLDAQSQVLFMWLCSFTDEKGQCYPSVNRLAECCGLSRNTIIERVKVLIEKGFLTKTERFSENSQQTNLYQIHLIPSSPEVPPSSNKERKVVHAMDTPSSTGGYRTKTKELYIKELKQPLEKRIEHLKNLKVFTNNLFKR